MACCFIVASNSEAVLRSCLLASPDVNGGVEVSVQRGAASAAIAYNRGIQSTRAEVMIFAHQDVYLPPGWALRLERILDRLERDDPNWGVLGCLGVERGGAFQGHLYSTGLGQVLGRGFAAARQVETLDEVMLILRRSSGLRFDEKLSGFHLYGTDICLEAQMGGLRAYAIPAFCIHNSNGLALLPWAYWKCWLHMRRKWSSQLPLSTPCMPITRWGGAVMRYFIRRTLWLAGHRKCVGRRVTDPSGIWRKLRENGAVDYFM